MAPPEPILMGAAMSDLVALRPGTILADDYRIEKVLGAGGFGITYLAEEIPLARLVTIKEYFPIDFAARDAAEDVVPRSRDSEGDYSWGLDRFLAEAQTLARFTHPNIVRVYRYFLARNTGYIVLHYEDGTSLKGWLRNLGRAPRQPEMDRILDPLLGALETVHAADYLHRDIAPDNIMIRRDGEPVLIDFGSARGDIAKHSKTISALVKPGYSPFEQYATTSRQQGPWTDIYSLGATLYEAVTGRRPPDSPSRLVADELIPPADAALSSYRPGFLAAIGRALKLDVGERPKSVAEWRAELFAPAPQKPEKRTGAKDKAAAKPAAERVLEPAAAASGVEPRVDAAPQPGRTPTDQPSPKAAELPPRPPRGGLAAAFLDGWRRAAAAPPAEPIKVEKASRKAAVAAKPAPDVAERAKAAPAAPKRIAAQVSAEPVVAAPPSPPPGARKASPRAIRRTPLFGSARALVAKLVVGIVVAAGVVTLQDQLPTIRREGGGILTGQINADVPLAVMKGHRGVISGLAFQRDGQQMVSASADGTVRVWAVPGGQLLRTIELDAGPATAFAASGERVVTGHGDGTVALWDTESGSKRASFKHSDAPITAVVFAGSGDRVAAAGQDRVVALWDASKPQAPEHLLEGHDGVVRTVAYGARGPFVASGDADATVKLWRAGDGDLVRTYRGLGEAVAALTFDPAGRSLAAAGADGSVRLWSTYSNRLRWRLKAHEGGLSNLSFAAGGAVFATGAVDGSVRVWDAKTRKLLRTLQGASGSLTALGLTSDGRRVAAGASDGSIRVLEAARAKAGS
jgi:hypothetical protein